MIDISNPKTETGIFFVDNSMQKNCGDCGVFITKDRWIKKNRPDNAYPVCADCQEKYEDIEFL